MTAKTSGMKLLSYAERNAWSAAKTNPLDDDRKVWMDSAYPVSDSIERQVDMAYSYELTQLDPLSFEHMINSLALRVLGSGATGFGPGRDGGRDGYFEGEAPYPSVTDHWRGIWYIQSKFMLPTPGGDPHQWLFNQIDKELKAFDKGAPRKWPDNWIVATNVDPSGVAETGCFDRVRELIRKARPQMKFALWGGRKILDLLQEYPRVAEQYGHFLTSGNVLKALFQYIQDDSANPEEILTYFIVRHFHTHRYGKLDHAGSAEDILPGVQQIFVDLPYRSNTSEKVNYALKVLTKAAASSQRPIERLLDERWRLWQQQPSRARIFFIKGGPGQGKSTLGQYLSQIQRAAFIAEGDLFNVDAKSLDLANSIKDKSMQDGYWPKHPRIPIQIELKHYAQWRYEQFSAKKRVGIFTYLAGQIGGWVEKEVKVGVLQRLLAENRWLVIFDGLDEVPSDQRGEIAKEVCSFISRTTQEQRSDMLVMCTSRPQGYTGQFDDLEGATLELTPLSETDAMRCAIPVLLMGRTDEQAQKSYEVLRSALQTGAVRELMTTPLQAHIMAILVRDGRQPPEQRWQLFEHFYNVMYQREMSRGLPDTKLSMLLRKDAKLLRAVHNYLGFALHVRAETSSGAQASLTRQEFLVLVRYVVTERGEDDLDATIDAVDKATTERLVLVNTPESGDSVRFDIRQLQEFFAAEFLYCEWPGGKGRSEALRERLECLSCDVHWREVIRFTLGGLVEQKLDTELAVALQTLYEMDQGEEGIDRTLRQYEARGAKSAAVLLSESTVDRDKRHRSRLRPCLDTLTASASLTDFLPDPAACPNTTRWLREYLLQRLREVNYFRALGGATALARLLDDDTPLLSQALDALRSLPLLYQKIVLSNAAQFFHNREYSLPDHPAPPLWLLEWTASFLADDEAVETNLGTVSRAISLLAGATKETLSSISTKLGFGPNWFELVYLLDNEDRPEDPDPDYVEVIKTELGIFRYVSPCPNIPDKRFSKLSRRLRATSNKQKGLFAIIEALVHFAGTLRKDEFIQAVCLLGKQELGTLELIALDLRKFIPSLKENISLQAACNPIKTMTNEQFTQKWSLGHVGEYKSQAHFYSFIYADAKSVLDDLPHKIVQSAPDDLKVIGNILPKRAIDIWMAPLKTTSGERISWLLGNQSKSHIPPRRAIQFLDPVTLKFILEILFEEPTLLLNEVPTWGEVLDTLAGQSLAVELEKLRGALSKAASDCLLTICSNRERLFPFQLKLPEECNLLVPIIGTILGNIAERSARPQRHLYDAEVTYMDLVQAYVPNFLALRQCSDDLGIQATVRAAAIFMATLHPLGGLSFALDRKDFLTSFSATPNGTSTAMAFGLCMDCHGAEDHLPSRTMLSFLLYAAATSGDTKHWEIDGLLKRWLNRSCTPAQRANVFSTWLQTPELAIS